MTRSYFIRLLLTYLGFGFSTCLGHGRLLGASSTKFQQLTMAAVGKLKKVKNASRKNQE